MSAAGSRGAASVCVALGRGSGRWLLSLMSHTAETECPGAAIDVFGAWRGGN